MNALERLTAAKQRADEAMKEARGLMQQAFKEGADELFTSYPILGGFSWTQYTPWFNDGESCEFSVHSDYPNVWFSDEDYDEDVDYDGGYEYWDDEKLDANKRAALKAVKNFLRSFDEELFRSAFGDHVKVTVKSAGVTVDEYDHD